MANQDSAPLLGEIFRSLAAHRRSGTLRVRQTGREKLIYFEDGALSLLSSARRARLGQLLVATGKITADDLDLAVKLQRQNKLLLGEILVEEGFCDEDDITRIVRYQIEGEIYDLFLWQDADFEFVEGPMPAELEARSSQVLKLRLDTDALVSEALQRLREWRAIQRLVSSPRDIPVLTGKPLSGLELPMSLQGVLSRVDGETAIEDLAEHGMMSNFEICRQFAELVDREMMRVRSPEELREKGYEALSFGRRKTAAIFLTRLEELEPTNLDAVKNLAECLEDAGRDGEAILRYRRLASALEAAPGKDKFEALRDCYTAIRRLDTTDAEAVSRLVEIEEGLSRRERKRRRRLPLLVALGALIAMGLFALWTAKQVADRRAEDARLRAQLQGEIDRDLKEYAAARSRGDWRAAHATAMRVFERHERYRQRPGFAAELTSSVKKMPLVVPVTTIPKGFQVLANGKLVGATSPKTPTVMAEYDPRPGRLLIELKQGAGDEPVYSSGDAFKAYRAEPISVVMSDSHQWEYIGEARADVRIGFDPASELYLVPTRDGELYFLDKQGLRQGKSLRLGEYGDVLSGVAIDGGRAYLGLSEGGAVAIDPANRKVAVRYPSRGPVHGRPLVLSDRVIFGAFDGALYFYRRDGARVRRFEALSAFPFEGLASADGRSVIFAGLDNRLRRLDLDGRELESRDLGRDPAGPPWLSGGRLALLLDDGAVALTAADSFAEVTRKRFRWPVEALCSLREGFIAATAAALIAFDGAGRPLWTRPLDRRARGARTLARMDPWVLYSCQEELVYAIDQESGAEVWRGRLKNGRPASPFSCFKDHFLVGLDGLSIVKFKPGYE